MKFGIKDFSKIKRFLCIGAHSDDIEMRCGGVFARLVRQGALGMSIVGVEGPYVRGNENALTPNIRPVGDNIKLREQEAIEGAKKLGASELRFLRLHPYHFYKETVDNNDFQVRCPDFSDYEETKAFLEKSVFTGRPFVTFAKYNKNFMNKFKQMIKEWAPDAIFTHSLADRHPDHYAMADLVFQAVSDLGIESHVPVFQWHSGSFGQMQYYQPTHYIVLEERDVKKAITAMKCFNSQFEPHILASYIQNAARTFGSFVNVEYAQPLTITHFPEHSQIFESVEYFKEEHISSFDPEIIKFQESALCV